jgi:hypothetical protein
MPVFSTKKFSPAELSVSSAISDRILPSLVLAPSAHNTQPWRFKCHGPYLDIFIDWDRHLTESDPTMRQLYVSLGCALANAKVAARYWHLSVQETYLPPAPDSREPILRLRFTPAPTDNSDNELFHAIEARRTDRSLYDTAPLTPAERQILDPALGENVHFLENRSHLEAIAKVSETATYDTLSRPRFKAELSHWVRNNWTHQPDGMPGYAMGMPAPISLLGSFLVRHFPIHKQEGPKTHKQITSASAVAVIATPTDEPLAWLRSGEALEFLWLQATVANLAAMPIAAAIEASGTTRQELQSIIGTSAYPQALLRLGHSQHPHLRSTPRRSLEDCLEK